MTSLTFDTLNAVTMLKKRGFTDDQAAGVVETLRQIDVGDVATKGDVQELKSAVQELKSALRETELRITIKLGGLLIAGVGVLAGMKFFG